MVKRAQPTLDKVTTIQDDGSRFWIHPADVKGFWTRWRTVFAWILLAIYCLLPFISINGNPAVFFDVMSQRIHLFGFTLPFEQIWMLFFLFTGLGFTLFFITAIVGRVWCGWACPQTVFMEFIYRPVERLIEGDAAARRKLDAQDWDAEKVQKRMLKLGIFLLISFAFTHIFMSYFLSVPTLYQYMTSSPLENWGVFLFTMSYTALVFGHFTWFREQFCIILCPYGRFQSALIDDDSVVIGYDAKRGEPRGKVGTPGAGDCIECGRCVAVCPTGIDIRHGLQMECVACSNCIDACDEIMERVERPKGLIRYDSMHALAGGRTHLVRPRLIIYTLLALVGAGVMAYAWSSYDPVTLSVRRIGQGGYFVIHDGQTIRNQFTARIINADSREHTFTIEVESPVEGLEIASAGNPVTIEPSGERQVPIIMLLPARDFDTFFDVSVRVRSRDGDHDRIVTVPFVGPNKKRN